MFGVGQVSSTMNRKPPQLGRHGIGEDEKNIWFLYRRQGRRRQQEQLTKSHEIDPMDSTLLVKREVFLNSSFRLDLGGKNAYARLFLNHLNHLIGILILIPFKGKYPV